MRVLNTNVYVDNTALPAIVRIPDQEKAPGVVFHNGYAAYKEMYNEMAERLCRAGYITLQFDPRGTNGDARGNFLCGTQWREDVVAAISYVYGMAEADNSRIALAGVSMGGGMTLLHGAVDPRIRCLFSMAPPARFSEGMREKWLAARGEAAWQAHLAHLMDDAARCAHGFPSERMDGLRACWGWDVSEEQKEENRRLHPDVAQELTLASVFNSYLFYHVIDAARNIHKPTCLVHGTADETISYHDSELLFDAIPTQEKELHLLEGKPHVLPEEAVDDVSALAIAWFAKYL